MHFVKQIGNSVKKSVVRFPAAAILTIVACVSFSIAIHRSYISDCSTVPVLREKFLSFGLSSCWAILFSLVVQLVSELLTDKRGYVMKRTVLFIIEQGVSIIIGLGPGYLFCRQKDAHFLMIYWGTFCALAALCPLLLSFFERKETVVPHILCSAFFASFIAGCIGAGVSVILVAMNALIHEMKHFDEVMEMVWVCCELFFFVNCFISFVTDKEKTYEVPKFFKDIMTYVLLPLYAALVVVLYGYLVKCLATWSLPGGKINWFVSFVTAFYLLFYFTLQLSPDSKVISFFYKFGALILVPLVVTQIVAFAVRIQAYGLTPVRYASLIYIIFTIWCVVMSLVKSGRYMMLAFPVLALFCLFATCTNCNVLDAPVHEQSARLQRVLEKNNLFEEGRIVLSSGEQLSLEDRKAIESTFDELSGAEKRPAWLMPDTKGTKLTPDDFKTLFGFEYDSLLK